MLVGEATKTVGLPEGLAELPAGSELAGLLASIDLSRLSDHDTVLLMRAWSRQVAHCQAQLFASMVEVARRSPDSPDELMAVGEFASEEIRAALCLTQRAADNQLALAQDLVVRLPEVWQALSAGQIDLARARVICDATASLDEASGRGVAELVLERAAGETTGQLGARLRRLVAGLDPAAAKQAYEQAVTGRRVVLEANPDGSADIWGCDLPAERAVAAMRSINLAARAAKRHGDPRSMDQLRADIFLDRLGGCEQCGHRRRAVLDLQVDLATLAGLAETPGEIGGFGPVIADVARQIAATQHDAEWRVTVTDPDTAKVVWNGITRRRPTAAQRRYIQARHRHCVFPGCRIPALDCDLDHTHRYTDGGRTCQHNLEPLCRRHHRAKDQGRWQLRQPKPGVFQWTSPLGHHYIVQPAPP